MIFTFTNADKSLLERIMKLEKVAETSKAARMMNSEEAIARLDEALSELDKVRNANRTM